MRPVRITRFFFVCLAILSLCSFTVSHVMAEGLSSKLAEYQLRKAREGDLKSQIEVAKRYETGRGLEQDPQQALFWYRKAAEQGDARAQFKVGEMLSKGTGVEKDVEAAKGWLDKAARQGFAAATSALNAIEAAEKEARARAERETAARKAKAEREARARAAREKAAREKAERERAAREKAAREKAERERLAREAAARERAQHEAEAKKKQTLTVAQAMEILRAGGWSVNGVPIEYLPSARTSCVKQGANRLLCFTGERNVNLGDRHVRYQIKSEIQVSEGGMVDVQYRYQVLKLRRADKSLPAHDQPVAPALELGWQAPHRMQCRLNPPAALDCANGDGRHYALNR